MRAADDVTGLPERPIDPDWLALREGADARARDRAAAALLPPLLADLAGQDAERGLRVIDLGSGTGANPRWLAPRLPGLDRQRWTLVDHDPRLFTWGPARLTTVRADVADLGQVLARRGGADLVTAAALLDLLPERQLATVVDAVVAARVPALFSLTVTGQVELAPADSGDSPLAAVFDDHQRRDSRPGPDAGPVVAQLFRDHGYSVIEAPTPWRLTSGEDAALIGAWLDGRAEAVVEHRPDLAAPAGEWLARRHAQLAAGRLEVLLGHLDLLARPGRGAATATAAAAGT